MDKNNYLIALSQSEITDPGRTDFQNQGKEQKVFSAVWALEGEVYMGGFAHYFSSHEGNTANFAPTALQQIGAFKCASIVDSALKAVSPDPLPNDKLLREQIINSLSDEAIKELERLDSEFYKYPDDLTELLFAYVVANPKVFGGADRV